MEVWLARCNDNAPCLEDYWFFLLKRVFTWTYFIVFYCSKPYCIYFSLPFMWKSCIEIIEYGLLPFNGKFMIFSKNSCLISKFCWAAVFIFKLIFVKVKKHFSLLLGYWVHSPCHSDCSNFTFCHIFQRLRPKTWYY